MPILEAGGRRVGVDFLLAYSPERVDPGNPEFSVRNTPRIVAGVTDACSKAARLFYERIAENVVDVSSPAVAEMGKLIENTYRQVTIGLANEMAMFCHDLGIDIWEAIDAAATKPFGFQAFYPGPGVGGHCIPIDPNYLAFKVEQLGYPFRFVELASEVNNRMPRYVSDRVGRALNDKSKSVRGSRILLLGVTYKADVADMRDSPSLGLAKELIELGADLAYHDPYIAELDLGSRTLVCIADLEAEARRADIVVLLQMHAAYDAEQLIEVSQLIFDTRGVLRGGNVERL
jgi:nucleotide sugar dehydrogenase